MLLRKLGLICGPPTESLQMESTISKNTLNLTWDVAYIPWYI